MQITPATGRTTRLDLSVVDGTLGCRVPIHPGYSVRCGTPLVPDSGAWRPARGAEIPLMFASELRDGGEMCHAYRAMIVETHVKEFTPGEAIRIADVQDAGAVTFEADPTGRYRALSHSRVLLG